MHDGSDPTDPITLNCSVAEARRRLRRIEELGFNDVVIFNRGDDTSLVHTALSTVAAVEAIEPLYGTSALDGRGKMLRAVELLDAAGVTLPVAVA